MPERVASPRVTVLLAVRDGARFLRGAIESVLAQSLESLELLVVDDGSRDATPEIIRAYGDPRIVSLRHEHARGLTQSLNAGLEAARGEYVARLDADDECEPDRLRTQVSFMEANPDVAALGSGFTKIDSDGRNLGVRPAPAGRTDVRWRLLFHNPLTHSSMMIRRRVFDEVGLFDEQFRYAQDHDMWCRIARRMPIEALQEPLIRKRIHDDSITATLRDRGGHGPVVTSICSRYAQDVVSSVGLRTEEYGEAFVREAFTLLYRPGTGVPIRCPGHLSGGISLLHDAFCRYYRLDAHEVEDRERWLDRVLRRRLLELARTELTRRRPRAALSAAGAALRVW